MFALCLLLFFSLSFFSSDFFFFPFSSLPVLVVVTISSFSSTQVGSILRLEKIVESLPDILIEVCGSSSWHIG